MNPLVDLHFVEVKTLISFFEYLNLRGPKGCAASFERVWWMIGRRHGKDEGQIYPTTHCLYYRAPSNILCS